MSSTGELIDIERVTISSEGDRWKSTRWGNSLAVYPTSSPVLEQRWAGRLTHRLSQIERTELSITLVSAENVRNARAIQRSDVAVGAQAGVFIKRLHPGG